MRRPNLTEEQRRVWYLREAVNIFPDLRVGPNDKMLDLISEEELNNTIVKWNKLIEEIKDLEGNIPEDNKKFIKNLSFALRTFCKVAKIENPEVTLNIIRIFV